jgi:hypothetical protein
LNGRTFNINPGAVGTYGLCLSSHKSTGGRPDCSAYAYGFHSHLFFGGDSYYERVMMWEGSRLVSTEETLRENRFPEYREASRVARFEELVRTLRRNDVPVELMADREAIC